MEALTLQFGRYHEEFEVGARYRHWPGKTVTEYGYPDSVARIPRLAVVPPRLSRPDCQVGRVAQRVRAARRPSARGSPARATASTHRVSAASSPGHRVPPTASQR